MPRRRLYGLTWLAEQAAARVRRKNWGVDSDQLAEEMWTILVRLRDAETQSVTVPDENGEPVTNDYVTREELDLLRPTQETIIIEQPGPDPSITTRTFTKWERWTMPCRVDSHSSGQIYNCTIFPFGDMPDLAPSDDPTSGGSPADFSNATGSSTQVMQLQIDTTEDANGDLETIPASSWTLAVVMRQYKVTQTLSDGAVVGEAVSLLQEANYMQVPVWL